ncbi:MAG: GNAT family N-acetyltransferase, partial [Armatimonadia bacterium]|nr:GNAT family N-acetyltransferase [Armatimonadia bacterium]
MAAIRAERDLPREEPQLRRFNLRRDLDGVLDFQFEVYESNFPGFHVNQGFRDDYTRDLRRAAGDPTEMMFVLEQEGQLCGFIWGSLMATLVDPRVGYIKNVYVAPHLRGQGHAERLMQVMEAWLWDQGAEKIMLDASMVNQRAVAFYEKVGYGIERVRMVKRPEG